MYHSIYDITAIKYRIILKFELMFIIMRFIQISTELQLHAFKQCKIDTFKLSQMHIFKTLRHFEDI